MKNAFKEIAIEKMEVFVAFVHHKTLTKTGRAIGMSTSGVNNVILSIEKTLGEPLYLRKVGRLILTEMGAALFRVSQEVLAAIENVHFEKSKDKNQQITIAATIWDSEYILPDVLRKFKKKYPNVTVKLLVGTEYINLANDECDVSIGLYVAKHAEINQRLITECILKLYASKEYLDKRGTPTSFAELKGHCLLIHTSTPPLPDHIHRNNKYELLANSFTPLLDFALDGLGIAVLPSQVLTCKEKYARELVSILPEFEAQRYGMFFLSRRTSDKEEMAETLFQLIKEKYD